MVTTTSISFSRIREFKSSKADAQPQWPDPEASIGRWYRTIGRQECWELCGPGRVSHLSLAGEIKDYLEKHGEVISATVIWSAYMIGKCKRSANPTVFFCSHNADARSSVRRQIKSSGLLARYPAFRTAESNRPPHLEDLQQLAKIDSSSSEPSTPRYRCCNATSRSIKTQLNSSHSRFSFATIGAVMEVDSVLYFSTVAHAFGGENVWKQQQASDFECDLDDEDPEAQHQGTLAVMS